MDWRELEKGLLRFEKDRGFAMLRPTPKDTFDTMFAFYRDVRAEGIVPGVQNDVLLFQYGIYDWGDGRHFELDVTRQVVTYEESDDGDEESDKNVVLFQLHARFFFVPTAELEAIGEASRWCDSVADLDEFLSFVRASHAYEALADRTDGRREISFGAC